MKIFFGRISITNKPEQIDEAYYYAHRDSTYFGALSEIEDFNLEPVYVFMIADKKVHLWKAKNWGEDGQNLYFDVILENIEGMNGAWLQAFKFFYLNLDLIIFTVRRPFKKAFFEITFDDAFTESSLLDSQTYQQDSNYRQIHISNEKPDDISVDFHLYQDNQVWNISETSFFDNTINQRFRDNSKFLGQGRKKKDGILKRINTSKKPTTFNADQLSILGLYDAFFCNYGDLQSEESDSLEIRGYYKYAPGKQATRWGIDLTNAEMSVDYREFDLDVSQINSQQELNVKIGLEPNDKTNTTWNLFLFKDANIGDVIFANKGKNTLVGIGIVTGDYRYEESRVEFKHVRSVNWIVDQTWEYQFERIPNYQTLFRPDTFSPTLPYKQILSLFAQDNPQWIDTLKAHDLYEPKFDITKPISSMIHSRNKILYGPPGTGKTYHTINKALAIIEGVDESILESQKREDLRSRYKAYVDLGQIVFTTFHQSLSYEDFVEGIKPVIEEDKDGIRSVVYEIKDGIFKSLCYKARVIPVEEEFSNDHHFDDAWNALLDETEKQLLAGKDFRLDILTPGKGLKVSQITNNGNLLLAPSSGLDYTVSYSRLKELQKAIPDLSIVKNIDKEFRAVIGGMNSTAYWATLNFINNWLTKHTTEKLPVEVTKPAMPHVLIVDEINRGNVSAIFGELITLIEESKRAGASEALELVLPYSKEKFSVPSNLYIIGTMNTADRSVEALDSALRRRFSFTEMMPKYDKLVEVAGINLASVLERINKRIAALLDADHQIGHSYLINVKDEKELANAFNNSIVPLLKEYFYHDDEKIALVLGKGFVKVINSKQPQSLFAMIDNAEVNIPEVRQIFRTKAINETNIIESLGTFLKGG